MSNDKKGFTLVEVVVSFSLIMIIMIYLLKTISVISEKNNQLLLNQNYTVFKGSLLEKIYSDMDELYNSDSITINDSNNSITFNEIDKVISFEQRSIVYDGIVYELPENVEFNDVKYTVNENSVLNKYYVIDINLKVSQKNEILKIIYQSNHKVDENTEEQEELSSYDFTYVGREEEFVIPKSGTYKIEAWGAQGGSYNDTYFGGYGGYSSGFINLNKDEKLYIYVGSQPSSTEGGYNGGGNGAMSSSSLRYGGGGATHVAKATGLLYQLKDNPTSVIIVAGGGGGGKNNESEDFRFGGSGGGFIGNNAGGSGTSIGKGATQISGGESAGGSYCTSENGSFGLGGAGCQNASGGGSGWYGGSGGARSDIDGAGGGGSGYLSNSLTDKVMYCYECTESNDPSTKTISTTNVSITPISNYAKMGDGYVKITFVE